MAKQVRDNQYRLDAQQIRVVQGVCICVTAAQMPSASFDVVFLDPPFAEALAGPCAGACGTAVPAGWRRLCGNRSSR
ncbi:hypothetical protein ACU4GD_45925 [Cupriavidus basilensis]